MAGNPLSWMSDAITRVFGGSEKGTDFGTSFHTPVAFPYGGTVTNITTGGWGQEVDVASAIPGLGTVTQSLVHFDQVFVRPGQQIAAGQVVGLSGGQLSGGIHNATPTYSTGPHVEYDIWRGVPWQSASIDPLPFLRQVGSLFAGANAAYQSANNSGGIGAWLGTSVRDFFTRVGLVVIALLLVGGAVLAIVLGTEDKQTNVTIEEQGGGRNGTTGAA